MPEWSGVLESLADVEALYLRLEALLRRYRS